MLLCLILLLLLLLLLQQHSLILPEQTCLEILKICKWVYIIEVTQGAQKTQVIQGKIIEIAQSSGR